MKDKHASDEWSIKNNWSSESERTPKTFPFPSYSPDGRFYVTMRYQKAGWLWIMDMYRTSDNIKLGSYASHKLLFHGWRLNSSGVYVQRLGYSTSRGSFWDPTPSINFDRPMVVALVPKKEYENTVFRGEPVTAPNENGWYNTDVTVRFTATKPGVKVLTPEMVITEEGGLKGVTGTAMDSEGKEWSFTVQNIHIDKTPPEITVEVPADGAHYTLNEKILAKWSSFDEISDIDDFKATTSYGSPIDTTTTGKKTFTVEASDKAGNRTVKTIKYYVR